ncbi:MAG: heavy metal-associated domain-containing protein [Lachnospiraceae bacterium]|nr:heavy metal-associated domain-containing protein [Lachnospiraceae bacterium]
MIETVLKIDGMSCGMCESHINDVIRNQFKVKKVKSSHRKGQTIIISEEKLDYSELKNAISNTGYTVLDITEN